MNDLEQLVEDIKPPIELTSEQEQAVDLILKWATSTTSPQEFCLGGYAGTGKTTVIKTIIDRLWEQRIKTIVCAFTGKAVSVLGRKGIPAATLHSTLYYCEIIEGEGYVFSPREHIEGRPKLIVVDEASMVSTQLYEELLRHNTKLLFVGDPGQLEPVGDNPNLMQDADFVLSKIHRQAEKSAILQAATNVRNGGAVLCPPNQNELIFKKKDVITPEIILSHDIAICAKNKTRKDWNQNIRLSLGRAPNELYVDDKLIVLRNAADLGLFNGLILFVTELKANNSDHWLINAKDEQGQLFPNLKVWKKPFLVDKLDNGEWNPKGTIHCDFGYMITCHKSQGSEWDKVLVIAEWMPPQCWDMKRWRYTAVTRAAKQLTYCF